MPKADLIAIDWGTSNFRAFLLKKNGALLDHKVSHAGLLNLTESYPITFNQQLNDWLSTYPSIPVLMCGMVGSSHGWQEIPYLTCPVSISAIAAGIRAIDYPGRDVRIVPGICLHSSTFKIKYDVMRGEETTVIGSEDSHESSQLFCLPGTHSKWVQTKDHTFIDFTTYFTGELFALLTHHSILAKQITTSSSIDWQAFDCGVQYANQSQALLADIFNIRPRVLLRALPTTSIKDYLSGLLIAHEIIEAQLYWQSHPKVTLLASPTIATRYVRALEQFKITVKQLLVDTAVMNGLLSLAIQSNMLKR